MIKGFIFDLDGVITDTAERHFQAWKYIGETLDIELDREFNESLKGVNRADSLSRILIHGGQERLVGTPQFDQLMEEKNDRYVSSLDTLSPKDILPGVLEFLKQAKEADILCGIASASLNAPFILDKLGLLSYFDVIVDPKTLEFGKPAPDIFLEGARLLGIEPQEAIGFEDAPSGVMAIKSAGMYAIGLATAPTVLEEADEVVSSFTELNLELLLLKEVG